jgi:hypothetical protein
MLPVALCSAGCPLFGGWTQPGRRNSEASGQIHNDDGVRSGGQYQSTVPQSHESDLGGQVRTDIPKMGA